MPIVLSVLAIAVVLVISNSWDKISQLMSMLVGVHGVTMGGEMGVGVRYKYDGIHVRLMVAKETAVEIEVLLKQVKLGWLADGGINS